MPEGSNNNDLELFTLGLTELGDAESILKQKFEIADNPQKPKSEDDKKTDDNTQADEDKEASIYAKEDLDAKLKRAERIHDEDKDKRAMYWGIMLDATIGPLTERQTKLLKESGYPVPSAVWEIQDRLTALHEILEDRKAEQLKDINDEIAKVDTMSPQKLLQRAMAIESAGIISLYLNEPKGKIKAAEVLQPLGLTLEQYNRLYKKSTPDNALELMNFSQEKVFIADEIERISHITEQEAEQIVRTQLEQVLKQQSKKFDEVNNNIYVKERLHFNNVQGEVRATLKHLLDRDEENMLHERDYIARKAPRDDDDVNLQEIYAPVNDRAIYEVDLAIKRAKGQTPTRQKYQEMYTPVKYEKYIHTSELHPTHHGRTYDFGPGLSQNPEDVVARDGRRFQPSGRKGVLRVNPVRG